MNEDGINDEQNYYLIQLYGKNPDAVNSIAKVSLDKTNIVSQYNPSRPPIHIC